ncbi:hypothetical protein HJG60_011176 [Phyllostomus discolor]|uniref:Uncharacterized protein n=1 Tax=Phyllostomus discolor TaxID=89673 RepID=A0A834A486_9CHIR|nr:hypothetical protein HJG60_011176 [Phyllostomus discolor]
MYDPCPHRAYSSGGCTSLHVIVTRVRVHDHHNNVSALKQGTKFCKHVFFGGGGELQKTPEFIYKKLCIYSYIFKLQSPSKYSLFDIIHLSIHFFYCSKQVLNSAILMPFSASVVFVSPLTSAKGFPLRTFFISGNKKKVARG